MAKASAQAHGAGYFVLGGIVDGLIAGMVMAMPLMAVTALMGLGPLAAPQLIGQTLLRGQTGFGVILLGLMVHMMNSAAFGIIWGLVWRGVARGGGTAIAGGLIYGAAIWVVMTYMVLPVLGSPMPGPVPALAWVMAHLMFGLVLGLWPTVQARSFAVRQEA